MAKDSLLKASTPEPFSTSKTSNWVARGGGLPPYIQHIAHDLVEKRGKTESEAIQMAIGIVKNWASGKGNVDENTRAAARKALAEWERLKAGAHAKVKEAVLEAAASASDPDGDGDDDSGEAKPTFCVKCRRKRTPTGKGKCPACGSDLAKASKAVSEAVFEAASEHWRTQPRDDYGKWRDSLVAAVRDLHKHGNRVKVGGVGHIQLVERSHGHRGEKDRTYAIVGHDGRQVAGGILHGTPEAAVQHALDASARSGHPESLGGSTNYRHEADARFAGARMGHTGESVRDKLTREAHTALEGMANKTDAVIGGVHVHRETKGKFTVHDRTLTHKQAASAVGMAHESNRRMAEPVDFNKAWHGAMNTDPVGRDRALRALADRLHMEGRLDEERQVRDALARYSGQMARSFASR